MSAILGHQTGQACALPWVVGFFLFPFLRTSNTSDTDHVFYSLILSAAQILRLELVPCLGSYAVEWYGRSWGRSSSCFLHHTDVFSMVQVVSERLSHRL